MALTGVERAFLAGVYASGVNDPNGAYTALAENTMNYILGSNPRNSSYLVGYGNNFPQQPHSRNPSGVDWAGFNNGLPNAHINFGALVGGPTQANDTSYTDLRSDYISNEVTIDYNAGLKWQASSDGGQSWSALGANAPSLLLGQSEEGKSIRLNVTYSDAANHAETVYAAPKSVPFVNNGQAVFALVGSGAAGETLTTRQSQADPDGDGTFARQWQVQSSAGGAWQPISGATAATFVPGTALLGQTLRLQLSYQDRQGFAETVYSNTVKVSAPPVPPPDQPILDPGGAIKPAVPSTSSPLLKASVGGSLWFQGFTAQITLTNTGTAALNSWSFTFTTTHRLNGIPWGASLTQVDQAGGLLRSTLTGKDWGATIGAGASVTVGFNASQGLVLGNSGSLTGPALLSTSATQLAAAAGGNPTYQTGNGSANVLKAGANADLLTGLAGNDVFQLSSLRLSLLGSMDRITDFSVGVDKLDGPTAVAAAQVARLGAVTALSEAALATLLTTQSFLPNKAATFTLGSGPTTRSFVALNDGTAGFQAANDGVVELTGYSGDLRGLGVV